MEIFFAFILAEKPKQRLAEKPIFDPSAFGFGTISTLVTFNNILTIANNRVSKKRLYGYILRLDSTNFTNTSLTLKSYVFPPFVISQ